MLTVSSGPIVPKEPPTKHPRGGAHVHCAVPATLVEVQSSNGHSVKSRGSKPISVKSSRHSSQAVLLACQVEAAKAKSLVADLEVLQAEHAASGEASQGNLTPPLPDNDESTLTPMDRVQGLLDVTKVFVFRHDAHPGEEDYNYAQPAAFSDYTPQLPVAQAAEVVDTSLHVAQAAEVANYLYQAANAADVPIAPEPDNASDDLISGGLVLAQRAQELQGEFNESRNHAEISEARAEEARQQVQHVEQQAEAIVHQSHLREDEKTEALRQHLALVHHNMSVYMQEQLDLKLKTDTLHRNAMAQAREEAFNRGMSSAAEMSVDASLQFKANIDVEMNDMEFMEAMSNHGSAGQFFIGDNDSTAPSARDLAKATPQGVLQQKSLPIAYPTARPLMAPTTTLQVQQSIVKRVAQSAVQAAKGLLTPAAAVAKASPNSAPSHTAPGKAKSPTSLPTRVSPQGLPVVLGPAGGGGGGGGGGSPPGGGGGGPPKKGPPKKDPPKEDPPKRKLPPADPDPPGDDDEPDEESSGSDSEPSTPGSGDPRPPNGPPPGSNNPLPPPSGHTDIYK